jgi:hypothetical protein
MDHSQEKRAGAKASAHESELQNRETTKPKGPPGLLLFLAGIIVAGLPAYILLIEKNQKHEDQIADLQKQIVDLQKQTAGQQPIGNIGGASIVVTGKPDKLRLIIQTEEKKYVKESYGEEAYQSFTQKDLDSFTKENRPAQIVAELEHNNEFLDVVHEIKVMPAAERQHLLDSCRELSHPKWGELGKISREGQTDAGQQAERMIATAVVAKVQQLLQLSDADFKRLYT